jgi:hypothetical protein
VTSLRMNSAEGLANWVLAWAMMKLIQLGCGGNGLLLCCPLLLKLTEWHRHCCSWQYMPLDSLKAIPPTLSAYWKSFMAFPSCECNPILEHSFKGVAPSLQVS